ncbi:N-acetylmuramoyl-L-alanine amidase CwlD [Bacillus carboniphilus]|uniref:N-acetylmuramoyl-L-alanine amidase CwlD n=1 Tax=Bacillus carboniphilus TaxID=86663 RepID=A0ABY9JRJ1_9BACI|nr:N-acetylmuramoyl-L-alanine amidase CwlD [Bacillus carboniphilus]WLR42019.1 N-acetylmuramoyl-L-alanine amidase CwlD [Bacillus carboniphilus]
MNKKLIWLGLAVVFIGVLFFIKQQFSEDASWKSWNLPLSGKIIYIDAGHGGPDGGAVGGDLIEKDITLQIAKMLRDFLQEQGALVLMTREEDKDLADSNTSGYSSRKIEDLKNRVDMINESEAELFVSIHMNALPSKKWSGAQTFYHGKYEENIHLAKFVQDELRKSLENTTRTARPIEGVFIMKYTNKPGALVEAGFLSNPEEAKLLGEKQYQEKVAASIYRGILRYFTSEDAPPD